MATANPERGPSSGSGRRNSVTEPEPGDHDKIKFAFAQDHILKCIMNILKPPELFICRRVSARWCTWATARLQKTTKLEFNEAELLETSSRDSDRYRGDYVPKKPSIEDFLDLNPPLEIDGNQQGALSFPCNTFIFRSIGPANPIFQDFLNSRGNCIRNLSVNFTSVNEVVAMGIVQTLLTRQTPNLRRLCIGINTFNITWHIPFTTGTGPSGAPVRRLNSSPLRKDDPEFLRIHQESNLPKSKLEILEIKNQISAKVFEVILHASPNLKEAIFDEYYLSFLLEPLNRLHLLKKLCLTYSNYRGIELYETLALASRECHCRPTACPQNQNCPRSLLQLRELILKPNNLLELCQWKPANEERIVRVINRLLEASANSLKSLVWDNMNIFHSQKSIRWPAIMSNVTKLTLGYSYQGSISESSLFPNKFSLANIFPKLKYVKLSTVYERSIISYFIKALSFEPVESVRTVHIEDLSAPYSPWKPIIWEREDLQWVLELFPNAQITHDQQMRVAQDPRII